MSDKDQETEQMSASGLAPLVQHLRENHRLTLLGSLAGKIVHGMNNTLTSLKANIPYLETCLETSNENQEGKEALQEIREATQTLEATVQAFDQYLRGEEEPGPVELWDALEMAHLIVEPKVRYSMVLELPDHRSPTWVWGRKPHLIQLLSGILLHIDSRPSLFGPISVQLADAPEEQVLLELLDLRPAGVRAHIPDGSHPDAGLDPEIGLLLTQHIALDHGGNLEVDVPRKDVTRYRCRLRAGDV